MADVLLINADYLKRYTKLNGSVEDVFIYPSVIVAQEMHLQTYLGSNLYEKIISDVEGGTITGVYQTLLDDYIRRAAAWWVVLELIPNLYTKIDNGGLMIRVSEDTTPISQRDFVRELDNARNKAHFYTDKMIRYLCANSELYPEYLTVPDGGIPAEKTVYNVAGFEISSKRR